ncbi:MAG: hypothetical protein COA78_24530 [Blastopirellula sp.]|nr:MAG: hypothetical protein COA78_24530 [Blastopirellula sp.]
MASDTTTSDLLLTSSTQFASKLGYPILLNTANQAGKLVYGFLINGQIQKLAPGNSNFVALQFAF